MKNKNQQSGFASIVFGIIIILMLGGGVYFYTKQKDEVKVEEMGVTTDIQGTSTAVETETVSKTSLPDSEFLKTFLKDDPKAAIMARGDINMDGYEDVIVQEIHCGASCSVGLQVVLNDKNITASVLKDKNYPDTFSPAFMSSSAAKSAIDKISIKNGIISLSGSGLACGSSDSEEPCTQEEWSIVKTVQYKFDGKNIVQLPLGEQSKTENFKKQPAHILSIKDLGNNTWSVEADLLTHNPAWAPGGMTNEPMYINQNSKIRTLTISKDTKVNSCDRAGLTVPASPNDLVLSIKKVLGMKDGTYINILDIEGSKITATYEKCSS